MKAYIEEMRAQMDGDAKVDALLDQVNVEASAHTMEAELQICKAY